MTKEELEAIKSAEAGEKEPEKEAPAKADDSSEHSQIDYDAIVKTESERKPDPIRAQIALKEREAKREEPKDDEDDDNRPLTRKELQELLASNQQATQKTLNEQKALALANSLSKSPSEASAIIATWRNRSFPTGMSVEDQIEEMYVAVNRKHIISERNEAFRALKNSSTVSKDAAGTHRDAPASDEPKMSAADLKGIKSAGYVWDGTKRVWKKPLQGGKKHLFMKDLKSPVWME